MTDSPAASGDDATATTHPDTSRPSLTALLKKVFSFSPSITVLSLYYRHACVFESSRQEFPCSALPQQGKKEEERKTTTISCFFPAEEEQSRGILGGNFQTRTHDGNKAAGLKVIG